VANCWNKILDKALSTLTAGEDLTAGQMVAVKDADGKV